MGEQLETVEVFGPKGRAIINQRDLQTYQAKGYRTADDLQRDQQPKTAPEIPKAVSPIKRPKPGKVRE